MYFYEGFLFTLQTSRVPIQGLGNVVPPQDPTFSYNEAAYNDDLQCQFMKMKMEQQFAGGDRLMEGCPHAGSPSFQFHFDNISAYMIST